MQSPKEKMEDDDGFWNIELQSFGGDKILVKYHYCDVVNVIRLPDSKEEDFTGKVLYKSWDGCEKWYVTFKKGGIVALEPSFPDSDSSDQEQFSDNEIWYDDDAHAW